MNKENLNELYKQTQEYHRIEIIKFDRKAVGEELSASLHNINRENRKTNEYMGAELLTMMHDNRSEVEKLPIEYEGEFFKYICKLAGYEFVVMFDARCGILIHYNDADETTRKFNSKLYNNYCSSWSDLNNQITEIFKKCYDIRDEIIKPNSLVRRVYFPNMVHALENSELLRNLITASIKDLEEWANEEE